MNFLLTKFTPKAGQIYPRLRTPDLEQLEARNNYFDGMKMETKTVGKQNNLFFSFMSNMTVER